MAKKHKHPEHVNHERWLISYADFITLLFAFFVVMFAVSQTDSSKLGRFTEAVNSASQWGIFEKASPNAPPLSPDGAVRPVKGRSGQGPGARRQMRGAVSRMLQGSIASGRVQVTDSPEGLVIRLRSAAYFESGSADLRSELLGDFEAVARSLRAMPNQLRIEGHTDSRPISSTQFRSNWELSAARAAAVLNYFRDQANIDASRMSIAGYADTRPVRDEDTPEAWAINRRVDIVVLDPTSDWQAGQGESDENVVVPNSTRRPVRVEPVERHIPSMIPRVNGSAGSEQGAGIHGEHAEPSQSAAHESANPPAASPPSTSTSRGYAGEDEDAPRRHPVQTR